MDMDKIVCACNSVTNGMIKEAVESGAKTLEEVQEKTGAGTVCGAVYRINDLASVLHNLKDPHNILFCFQCDSQ